MCSGLITLVASASCHGGNLLALLVSGWEWERDIGEGKEMRE